MDSSAGSVSQIRECAATLLKYAKSTATSIVIIGHITKRRDHRRTEDPRTHRGRRPAIRGRQQQHIPHPARHQEPLRRDVRNRRVRNAGHRTAGRGQSVGNPAHALRGTAERHRRGRCGRRRETLPDRSAGAGERRGLRHAPAHGHGIRHAADEHAAGGARKSASG